VLEQVAIVGSALRAPEAAPENTPVDLRLDPVAGPSHMLLAFGPRAGEVTTPRRAKVADADERILWERQREADLAFFKARLALLEKQ
jgi:hypothetical protein